MGRPSKRRRDVEEGPANVQDLPGTNDQSRTLNDTSFRNSSTYASQILSYSEIPLDSFQVPLDDSSAALKASMVNLDFDGLSSLAAIQSGLDLGPVEPFNGQSAEHSDNDPVGLLDGWQTVQPTDHSTSQEGSTLNQGCACLANLYSTLSSFQSLPSPSFPFSMGALSKATNVARDACYCKHCPTQYASALQNLMLLSTLLPLIAHEYGKLLAHVDDRALKGRPITFRMGEKEQSLENLHRHTGTADCPMAFDMDLTAEEWRSMARKAITRNVIGPGNTSVLGVVDGLEKRQEQWHENPVLTEFQHGKDCHKHGPEFGQEHTCLRLLSRVRDAVAALKLE